MASSRHRTRRRGYSTRPSDAAAQTSSRRRRRPSRPEIASIASTSSVDAAATAPGDAAMSPIRSIPLRGSDSHQGTTPTVWTSACHPRCARASAHWRWRHRPARRGCRDRWSPGRSAAATSRRAQHGGGEHPARALQRRTGRVIASPTSPMTTAPATGATKVRCDWTMKLATRAVTGSRRYSPHASDQHRKISSSRGKSGAEEFRCRRGSAAAAIRS